MRGMTRAGEASGDADGGFDEVAAVAVVPFDMFSVIR